MIVVKQTVLVFEVLLGTWQIQLALLTCSLLQIVRIPEPPEEIPKDLFDDCQLCRYLITAGNTAALFVLTIANAPGLNIPFFRSLIKLVIPFITTFAYILCVAMIMAIHYQAFEELKNEGVRLMVYFIMQSSCYDAFIIGTFAFILSRFFMKHKVCPEHWGGEGAKLETEESLIAFRELNNMYLNILCPLFVCNGIEDEHFLPPFTPSLEISQQFACIQYTSKVQAILVTFLIFVNYKKGPARWK